jgi:Tfp pilus assembly protein PilF
LVEKRKGVTAKAIVAFHQAAEIAERIGAKPQIAEVYRNIGQVSLEAKKVKDAKEFFQKAIALFKQLQNLSEVKKTQALLRKCNAG